jgi:hypothetical protein
MEGTAYLYLATKLVHSSAIQSEATSLVGGDQSVHAEFDENADLILTED